MSIEKRLSSHMHEQADRLNFPTPDPADITHRPPSNNHRVVAMAAALLMVMAAGAGFWALSQQPESTEIAAGQADDDADDGERDGTSDPGGEQGDGTGDGQGTAAPSGGAFVGLDIIDVTGELSPGSGQVAVDGGVYYVLSTAPGRVRVDEATSEEEWNRLFRSNTFYTMTDDGSWQANEVEDRLISTFDVDDGVIYVVSTGTVSGDETSAVGTSTDRGQSWDWQTLPDLPPAAQVAMLRTGDSAILAASRSGQPGYEEVLRTAREAGVDVEERSLRNFDSSGLTYVEIDADDPCSALYLDYGLADYAEWLRTAPDDEREQAIEEMNRMAEEIGPEFEAQGCSFDPEAIESLPLPEIATVTWAELGVEVPERWKPWSGVYRYQDGQLTELDDPFDGTDQIGYMEAVDGELVVYSYGSSLDDYRETRWITSDGIDWNSLEVTEENYESGYFPGGYGPPVAGNSTFRLHWQEPTQEEMEAYEEQMNAIEAGELTGEEAEVAMMATEFESGILQRSVAGGGWEDVDLDGLMPDLDLSNHRVESVQGNEYGVFIMVRDVSYYIGDTPEGSAGLMVLYSNNGTEWGSFETEGDWLHLEQGDGTVLAFDNVWTQTETGGRSDTKVLLLRPQG